MNFSWFPLYNNIEINDIIPPIAASMDFIQGYSKLRVMQHELDRFLENSSKYGRVFQKSVQLRPRYITKLKFWKKIWMSFPGFPS